MIVELGEAKVRQAQRLIGPPSHKIGSGDFTDFDVEHLAAGYDFIRSWPQSFADYLASSPFQRCRRHARSFWIVVPAFVHKLCQFRRCRNSSGTTTSVGPCRLCWKASYQSGLERRGECHRGTRRRKAVWNRLVDDPTHRSDFKTRACRKAPGGRRQRHLQPLRAHGLFGSVKTVSQLDRCL